MINLPPWAKPFLNDKKCPHCKALTHINGVIGIGVRKRNYNEEDSLKNGFLLTFEYTCYECSKKSLWIADPGNNIDMTSILEQIISINSQKGISDSLKNKISNSKISDKEIESLVKFMNKSKSYEDLLKYLGIESEYKKETENDKK